MKCHHCHSPIFTVRERVGVISSGSSHFIIESSICPRCNKASIFLVEGKQEPGGIEKDRDSEEILLYPRGFPRILPSEKIPQPIRDDYMQAVHIADISPPASAALIRRCLRRIFRVAGGINPGSFSQEIEQTMKLSSLPSDVKKDLKEFASLRDYESHPILNHNPAIILKTSIEEIHTGLKLIEKLMSALYEPPEDG